jgi:hypothetical protein
MAKHRNHNGLRNLLLILGVVALWDRNRRWNETFQAASLGATQVNGPDGKPRNGRRVIVQSVLPASPSKVWDRARQPATLVEVTHPLLGFVSRDGRPLPEKWQKGDTIRLRLLGLGLIPLGNHDIIVMRVDNKKRELKSAESGQLATIWNHTIRVEPSGEGQTLYTDEVDLAAGPLNPIIGQFAYFFFRYRQTRWQRLVRQL